MTNMQNPFMVGSVALILAAGISFGWSQGRGREFLTPLEIAKIQEAQEVDKRIKVYLEAAALRIKTSEDRLHGKESVVGDPLEFFSVQEMLDGYYRILRSVMYNLDDAVQKPSTDRDQLQKALKNLKESTEKAKRDLEILKKIAEEKKNEEVWNMVTQAMEITGGALEGAELGISQLKEKPKSSRPPVRQP